MRFRPRFGLSAIQLIATALAAITATVAASFLGVTGTVIGAALASVVSAIGTAVYTHSLHRTRVRVREVVPTRRREPTDPNPSTSPLPPSRDTSMSDPDRVKAQPPQSRWQSVAIGSLALFVTVLTFVTGVELVTGHPLSDLVRGDTGSGTSVFGTKSKNAAVEERVPAPTVTQTVTPSVVVVTPTVTQTVPAVTETATPTDSPTPTRPSTSATPSTTPAPSDQPTP